MEKSIKIEIKEPFIDLKSQIQSSNIVKDNTFITFKLFAQIRIKK